VMQVIIGNQQRSHVVGSQTPCGLIVSSATGDVLDSYEKLKLARSAGRKVAPAILLGERGLRPALFSPEILSEQARNFSVASWTRHCGYAITDARLLLKRNILPVVAGCAFSAHEVCL
jgi:hypothetical protein